MEHQTGGAIGCVFCTPPARRVEGEARVAFSANFAAGLGYWSASAVFALSKRTFGTSHQKSLD
jgi:hypothetical protein